jgi:biotin carboxylase
VTDAAGVTAFARDAGSFVVKPANRQASLGVVIVHSGDSPAEAWRECVEADEGPQVAQREFRWRYLVEEYLRGQEYSVEALVVGGEIVFSNVTAKRVQPGRHPIECGHVVPAPPAPAVAELSRLTQALARAVQFGTGLLHAEWIIRDEIPVLVECAARPAGDWIFDLIRQVTGVNLYSAAVNALAGELLQLVPAAQLDGPERTPCAAVRFAVPSGPGVVSDVSGIDAASSAPNVISVPLVKGAGDVIRTVDSSWCRLAAVIAAGSDAASAEAAAAEGLARISVRLDDIGD